MSLHSAQDDGFYLALVLSQAPRPLIAFPANGICVPHFSTRSSHLGFVDSINAIFLDLLQRFKTEKGRDHSRP
jgi:hypothetical protein